MQTYLIFRLKVVPLEDASLPQCELRQRLVVICQSLDFRRAGPSHVALELKHEEAGALSIFQFRLLRLQRGLGKLTGFFRCADALEVRLRQLNSVLDLEHDILLQSLKAQQGLLLLGLADSVVISRRAVT